MATHKVPQDVEADDKFLGPLSFKQFIFFGGVLVCLFLMYQTFALGVPYLSIIVMPFFIICVTLAFPWTKDQPTELWLASRIRFLLVPRRRIWDQEGREDFVTITAPKREVHIYSDGLSEDQVRSRLNALANVVDSKGWATTDASGQKDFHSDRLVAPQMRQNTLPQNETTDILDDVNSPLARQVGDLLNKSTQKRKQEAQEMMQALHPAAAQPQQPGHSPWFLQQQPISAPKGIDKLKNTPPQQSTARIHTKEEVFLDRVRQQEIVDSRQQNTRQGTRKIATTSDTTKLIPQAGTAGDQTPDNTAYAPSVTTDDPAILALSQRDDLNVSTIARRAGAVDEGVTVSLHNDVRGG